MAQVKYGGGVVQISGSIAGSVFARNRFGNYIRPRTKPVNPNSAGQVLIRSILAGLAQKWHQVLTPAERIAWATYAAAVAMKNRLGETIYLTGFNHYIRSNSIRQQFGYPTGDAGPTELSLPEKDPTFAVTASVATQMLSITFNASLPWYAVQYSIIAVYMGQPQLATRNFFGGPWKKAGKVLNSDSSPLDIAAPMTLVLGQKVWVYGRISMGAADGRLSEPMYAGCTVEA